MRIPRWHGKKRYYELQDFVKKILGIKLHPYQIQMLENKEPVREPITKILFMRTKDFGDGVYGISYLYNHYDSYWWALIHMWMLDIKAARRNRRIGV